MKGVFIVVVVVVVVLRGRFGGVGCGDVRWWFCGGYSAVVVADVVVVEMVEDVGGDGSRERGTNDGGGVDGCDGCR